VLVNVIACGSCARLSTVVPTTEVVLLPESVAVICSSSDVKPLAI